ncbi:MAG TPA: DMT family transporter [Acidimicrobiales bacterium]
MTKQSPRWGGTFPLILTIFCWAIAFPAIRTGLNGFSPWALGLCRLVVASVTLGVVAMVKGITAPSRAQWPRLILAGFIGQTLYQGLLMTGERSVPAGTASLLIAMAPLFSIAIAAIVLKEQVRRSIPGMLVAFMGTVLIAGSLGLRGGHAALIVLAAAACQGIYHVVVKPLAEQLGPFPATAWSVWAGTVLASPAAPIAMSEARRTSPAPIIAILVLGVVSSAFGYMAWSVALSRASIARTTAALYLIPVVALLLSWVWLGERPALIAVAGGTIAIVGVVSARHRPTNDAHFVEVTMNR